MLPFPEPHGMMLQSMTVSVFAGADPVEPTTKPLSVHIPLAVEPLAFV
jgi:hypothetical protein